MSHATRRAPARDDQKAAKLLEKGDVIWEHGTLYIVLRQNYPSLTIAMPEAAFHCEPELLEIRHQTDDRWVRTKNFRTFVFPEDRIITLNNSVRVQEQYRSGPFQTHKERTENERAR